MTTETAPRPTWFAALGGLAGVVVAFGWSMLTTSVVRASDEAGFRWPLPWPLALAATLLLMGAVWLPWLPLLRRVGFRWWHVLLAGMFLPATLALAGVAGVRLASGSLRSR